MPFKSYLIPQSLTSLEVSISKRNLTASFLTQIKDCVLTKFTFTNVTMPKSRSNLSRRGLEGLRGEREGPDVQQF